MPGPGKKRKPKANAKGVQATSKQTEPTPASQCLALEEDEITRCGQPATEGYPKPDRCKVHHAQYCTLYKKYKDASKVVDQIKNGAELPTKEQIGRFQDWKVALDKARWARKYLEAIRVEKAGREIHQRRFFLKVDDGHRRRLKLLEREMVKAVQVLDALQGRAHQLYKLTGALDSMNTPALSASEVDLEKQSKQTTEEILESIRNPEAFRDSTLRMPRKKVLPAPTSPEVGDEDLIDMSLRDQKEGMIMVLKPFMEFESFIDDATKAHGGPRPETEYDKSRLEKQFFVYQQFSRRIIFHEPALFMKSLGKVSLKDLILSDDFSVEDLVRFLSLFSRPMEFPLMWFKDAVLDALAISRHGTAANVGSVGSRFSLLGGWVFNRAHTISMSNEAWWLLLTLLEPPADVENRFVRLCNNFDDLIGFLSFAAFGSVPRPTFCEGTSNLDNPGISRNHLSLSGVIVADMVATPRPPHTCGPIPTTRRATQRGCAVWAELETRAYMFGAVRDERDGFVEAFLRELRARPDLFQVVLRSETAPGHKVEMFGSGPSNNEALPVTRMCQFEAPPSLSPPSSPPYTSGKWEVMWSAVDVLYGEKKDFPLQGYLALLARNPKGWFFRYKTFPVTYFVIVDTVPNRDISVLARNVSWAALRAGGYAEGEYTLRKYAVASDKLFDWCSQARLGWMPPEAGWKITRMEDQV
ncbi:hypothetical protein OG21DRAFT_1438531 [Imleria badia]|nr:hypothetical protein OG21DRAFT_1438531 [Imleria badia]